jgi:hypothetical protein
MKRSALSVVIAAGIVLAACSSSSTATTTTSSEPASTPSTAAASTTTTAAKANLQALSLSISDLPTGWSVDNSSTSPSSSCYSDPLTKVPSISYLSTRFVQGGSFPVLIQELGQYQDSRAAFDSIKSTLDACHNFTETSDTTTVSGSLGAMSFPQIGDGSAAYTATLSAQGVTVSQSFVLVRKGQILTIVALGDYGSVDTTQLQQFVNQAVAKLP